MMSDHKKDQTDDIVTSTEDAPEAISDDALKDANGGWSWGVTQPTVRSLDQVSVTGSIMDTIYAGVGNDTINADFGSIINPDSMLKR